MRRRALLAASLALIGSVLTAADRPRSTDTPAAAPAIAPAIGHPAAESATLAPRHAAWLVEVEPLIGAEERAAFLALGKDYQRDAFMRRFWEVRDPFRETPRNELFERWQERLPLARERYPQAGDARARALLLLGEPAAILALPCVELVHPVEAWLYPQLGQARSSFALIFVGVEGGRQGRYRAWRPSAGVPSLMHLTGGPGNEAQALARIAHECPRGDELGGALLEAVDFDELVERGHLVPRPSPEWVAAFTARSTDLPPGAPPLAAELSLAFPGRQQSRTLVAAVVAVERRAATAGGAPARPVYTFVVDGEVLRGDELFEQFRYRFDVPAEQVSGDRIPLVLERPLRPGPYTWIVRVADQVGGGNFRAAQGVEVPRIEIAPAAVGVIGADADVGGGAAASAVASMPPVVGPAPPATTAAALAEAHAALPSGDQTLRLLPLGDTLAVGKLRVEAEATGEGIARVAFAVDGKPVLAKSRPPYSVELDLGRAPRLHAISATAYDAAGRVLASDEIPVNAGPHHFAVRLVEPQRGQRYRHGLRAVAEVDVPIDEALERVELYLDDTLLATLYQPPYAQPLTLPHGDALAYVRAVAHLASGETAEDVAIVNAPANLQEYRVDLVELYTTVLDRRGRPVEELAATDFEVREEDTPQEIRRFERVRDLPIRAGLVIDTSSSMLEELPEAERAARKFFAEVLAPRDRACVVTFADVPRLAAPFTADREVLAGGLAGLVADGETALYDSIVFALHYFSGVRGKRALVVLTDGMDSKSRYRYDDVLEFARRAGVAIYTIGLSLPTGQADVRIKLQQLATETGGRAIYIQTASELESSYRSIQVELRSQFLLAYQSTRADGDAAYRRVEVRIKRPGLEAKTLRGYYP